mgnify:CR=1 FL=1
MAVNKSFTEENPLLDTQTLDAAVSAIKDLSSASTSSLPAQITAQTPANLPDSDDRAAYPAAAQELRDLQAIAREHKAPEADGLAPWDVAYWSEKLRQSRFDLDQEALRPWFPQPQVLEGLFSLCSRLFDVEIVAAN